MLHITDEGRALIRQTLGSSLFQRSRPITLAGPKPVPDEGKKRRQLRRQRFDRLVNNAEAILRTGRPTYFAFEGACIAGFRTSLILEGGWYWDDADRAARGVVGVALARIGAERPTLEQAQPEYTYDGLITRTRCLRCGHGIPEDRYSNGKVPKFCCRYCASSDAAERARLSHGTRTWAEWLAASAAEKEHNLLGRTKDCAHCAAPFIADYPAQTFCSRQCVGLGKATHGMQPCRTCETMFPTRAGRGGTTRFCSKPCASTAMWERRRQTLTCDDLGRIHLKPREDRACTVCSAVFRPKRPSDLRQTCSVTCQYRLRTMARYGFK